MRGAHASDLSRLAAHIVPPRARPVQDLRHPAPNVWDSSLE